MDLLKSTLHEIRDAIAAKKIKSEEVVTFFMNRSKELNPKINAFISFNENAIPRAKEIDRAIAAGKNLGPLMGVPIGVKDLLCTKDLKTTAGSKILHNFVPPYSATVVEKLESAGAVVLGKTNLDEFAMGSSNETSYFGGVKNPWKQEYVAGGSSGGSAAAVAARMVPAAIGTDTGGSIRQPANLCGIAGIKPTYGRVSRYGIVAYASSLDQAGPMAYNAKDAALVLEVISGFDKKDSTSSQLTVPSWVSKMSGSVKGLKIGLPKEYFAEGVSADTRKTVEAAVEHLKKLGAETVEVSLPLTKYAVATYYIIATSEASSNLARYDGVRFGHRAEVKNIEDLYMKSRGEGFGKEVKARIMLGTFVLSSGYYDAYYKKACQVRKILQNDFLKAFEKCDLLLSPVTADPAFKAGDRIKDPVAMYLNDIYTTSTNLAGLPGMSVPAGYSAQGLPIGVQLTAPHFKEEVIFNVAQALDSLVANEKRIPHV